MPGALGFFKAYLTGEPLIQLVFNLEKHHLDLAFMRSHGHLVLGVEDFPVFVTSLTE